MVKNSSVIEINGNRYDAVTGQLIGVVKRLTDPLRGPTAGLVIDGFTRKSPTIVRPDKQSKKTMKISTSKDYPKHPPLKVRLKQSAQNIHLKTQRPKTLMRSGVVKPPRTSSSDTIPKPQVRSATVSPARVTRIQGIAKNQKVRRFKQSLSVAAKKPAKQVASVGEIISAPSTALVSASRTIAVAPAMPSMITSVSHHQLERMLDEALTKADSHKQALKEQLNGKRRWQGFKFVPRWLIITAIVLALLAGGFLVWRNVPQVSMRIAAARSHIDASMPNYTPSGFSFAGPINTVSGAVTMHFKANTNNAKTFAITQEKSGLDSSSLAANITPKDFQVQTSEVNGSTVYIYGSGNDAVWVNNGVLYTIKDKADLDSNQILKIAQGL